MGHLLGMGGAPTRNRWNTAPLRPLQVGIAREFYVFGHWGEVAAPFCEYLLGVVLYIVVFPFKLILIVVNIMLLVRWSGVTSSGWVGSPTRNW